MSLPADNREAAEAIHRLYLQRKRHMGSHINQMNEIRAVYHNSVNLPLPELDKMEKPEIPNLVAQGIDQTSMRIASVMPDIRYASVRPGFQWADNQAEAARQANLGWWRMNRYDMKLPRRARHLVAYGVSPVSISPVSPDTNDQRKIPFWRVRNPMGTFPAPMQDHDQVTPTDCIFSDVRSYEWLKKNYPDQARIIETPEVQSDSDLYYVLEYVDDKETCTIVLGQKRDHSPSVFGETSKQGAPHALLSRTPNRAGICPVVYPKRIALDGLLGQFDSMVGMYIASARLASLNRIAVERDIFKDEWIQGNVPNQAPEIIQQADGRMGQIGVIHNGQIQAIGAPPGNLTSQTSDALERAQRLTAGIPSEMGGESGSNIRTARRGASVLGSAIDGIIQEGQIVLAGSMEAENRIAVATAKAYYGNRKSVFFGERYDGKEAEHTDYVANEVFERAESEVKYAIPGTDLPGLIVEIGQMIGDGTLSVTTGREMNPLITDPIAERDRVEVEGLRRAALQSLESGVQNGTVDPHQIALIAKMKNTSHVNIEDAIIAVHEAEQKKQAEAKAAQQQQMQAQPGEEAGEGEGPSPEAQSGLGSPMSNAVPGQESAPAIPQQPPAQQNLQSMLAGLGSASQVPGAEQQMGGAQMGAPAAMMGQ